MAIDIKDLLAEAVKQNASDLHLVSWSSPILRIDGDLVPMDLPQLQPADIGPMIVSLLTEEQRKRFQAEWELDMSITLKGVGRFRTNVHRQRGAIEAAFRVVSDKIRSIRQLGLPPVLEELARKDQGLILITGPTGSGKSTTLAAMVSQIIVERRCKPCREPGFAHPNDPYAFRINVRAQSENLQRASNLVLHQRLLGEPDQAKLAPRSPGVRAGAFAVPHRVPD